MPHAKRLTVALDVQHVYKPPPMHRDRGARFLYDDGRHVWEAELVLEYADAAASALREAGARVIRNDPRRGELVGWYWQRHRYAAAQGVNVYLACHVNAGGGRYALTCYYAGPDARPDGAATLAAELAAEIDLQVGLDSITGAHVRRYESRLDRGAATIRTAAVLGLHAVLLEPFFGDNARQLAQVGSPEGLRLLGLTIGKAVVRWWQRHPLPGRSPG